MNTPAPAGDAAAPGDVAAAHADALWAWHGEAFVRCAYRTLLRRPADEAGLRYYTARLSAGHSRMSVLRQISRSSEARALGVTLPGLSAAMQRHRRAHWPVIGPLFRLAPGEEGDSALERYARVQALRLEAMQLQQQSRWEHDHQAINDRLDATDASLTALRADLEARAGKLQDLVTDLDRFLGDAVRQQVAAHHQLRQRADMARDALGELRLQALDDRARLAALEQSLALLQRDLHDGVAPSEGLDSAELAALRALPASARQLHARLRRLRGAGSD